MGVLSLGMCEVTYGRRFLQSTAICKRYVRPAILYGNKAWCLNQSKIRVLRMNRTNTEGLMMILSLNKTIQQLAMANCVHMGMC